ncbi:MAG TPA: hypothetical protein PK361_06935, partial [Chiayiivirga sp.]|nr:hypothetical protein [Chiayiivirga sp.]
MVIAESDHRNAKRKRARLGHSPGRCHQAPPDAVEPTQTHRAIAMIFRLLLISFILSLAFDAHAAIDTIRSSSGDSGGPCPSAAADAPSAAPGAPADAAAPKAARKPRSTPPAKS